MATILVADDDQLLRAIIRNHLERAGHAVLEAGDGIAAMDLALEERPEALLLDVMMPLARGLEVVRRVRGQEGWRPAIVMISVRTRVSDRLNALEAGADAYVEKPFEPVELLATVEHLLTDAAPTRFIDLLGPVWATIAIEGLAREALERRTHAVAEPAHVEALFTDLVGRSLGHAPPGAPAAADAMRLVWEDAICALLRDAAEPAVPTAVDLAPPDAVAAVEGRIARETLIRHRLRSGPPGAPGAFWSAVLDDALAAPRRRTPNPAPSGAVSVSAARLRAVLRHEPAPDTLTLRWSTVLADVLAGDPAAATIDPLPHVWLAVASPEPAAERIR